MKKMIKKLLLLIVLFSLSSCAQNKGDEYNKIITFNKEEMNIPLKKESFVYRIRFENKNCSYEILIDDFPVAIHYGLGEFMMTNWINEYLLETGERKLTVRLRPAKIDNTSFQEYLDSTSRLTLKLQRGLEGEYESLGKEQQKTLIEYETPEIEEKEVSEIEFTTYFTIEEDEINWDVTGWRDGQVLEDTPELKEEVITFYKNFQDIVEKRRIDKVTDLFHQAIFDKALVHPTDPEYYDVVLKNFKEDIDKKQTFIYPLDPDDVALKFYADNRVVTLVFTMMEGYGYSPLISKDADNNIAGAYTFYLYKPKGSNELQIIR